MINKTGMDKKELKKYRLQIAEIYLNKCMASVYFIVCIIVMAIAIYYFWPKWYLFASLAIYIFAELLKIRKDRREYLRYKLLAEDNPNKL